MAEGPHAQQLHDRCTALFQHNGLHVPDALLLRGDVRLKITLVKDAMMLCGLPKALFWGGYFVSHFFLAFCSMMLCLLMMLAFGMEGVKENNWFNYIMLYMCMTSANILLGYITAFFVNSIEMAQEAVSEGNNLVMSIPWAIVVFAFDNPTVAIENIFSIIPGFGLYRGLAILETAALSHIPYSAGDFFVWDNLIIQACLVMVCTGIVLFFVLCFLDDAYSVRSKVGKKIARRASVADNAEDAALSLKEDEEELGKIVAGIPEGVDTATLPIWFNGVEKWYTKRNGKRFHALKGIHLGVEKGCIFGLLGPNGAGKSTAIKCITGSQQTRMDGGNAFIQGKSCVTDLEAARQSMGVCPQFNALIDMVTAREHLWFFARLRGVNGGKGPEATTETMKGIIEHYLQVLDLEKKADCQSKTLSGGNKRKLSVAIAMLANPIAVFLDEPSSGMDPLTKRTFWNFCSSAAASRAIILTTHSMEEADALCGRIGIMVRGGLRTIGSSQELKAWHGGFYYVVVRMQEASRASDEAVENLAKQICADTKVDAMDAGLSMRRFAVPMAGRDGAGASLSEIFECILKCRDAMGIIDFAVSQATLEDVFLSRLSSKDE
eukprot:NODE_704_length_2818_cov_8.024898.p1 GENE.NODE_704_length_2818_cov_8.024898~~NODE_704_length_2818_cov_8.024898.p1  ORF type:complete len:606 (+),score=200.33 NODE_704_length_2818_cov_8.024898:284-2101(+)